MTENSRIELLGRWTKAALRAVFINYFYLTLVVIGIALLLVPPILVPVRQESTPLYRASAGIGQAILVAGAVTTFMRFFASLDIVGERIQKWLTNDAYLDALVGRLCRAVYEPDKVAHLGNLTAIWRKISLAITRNAFPGIAEKMYDDALKQMLKATSDYYLDTYRRVTHVRLLADDPVRPSGPARDLLPAGVRVFLPGHALRLAPGARCGLPAWQSTGLHFPTGRIAFPG